MYLMARMGYTLAYIAPELDRLRAATRVGDAAAAALFPAAQPIVEPIQPNGQTAPRLDVAPLPPAGAPTPGAAAVVAALDRFFPEQARRRAAGEEPAPSWLASNNWAVAGSRTRSGRALLAGDPHLELTLPSIWYEAHLVVPGVLDVYGVTIPGAPGIVIGFNRDVAWTFTNTGADVLDLYAETVDDAANPTRYRLDGAWRPLELRAETYLGKRGEIVAVDTVRYTHRGPMQRLGAGGRPAAAGEAGARWVSMRWTVLEPGDELAGFQQAARARTVAEFQGAMARRYRAPAQNMLVADRAGTIAIRSTGAFPVRPGDGRGDVIRDGTTTRSDWRGYLPPAAYPQGVNPAQGYLASANQQPIDPRATAGYWGGSYEAWRALRLNAILRQARDVTPDAMRQWQTDPGSARADWFVPRFLDAAAARAAAPPPGTEAATLAEARRLLAGWDRRYTADDRRAVLFEAAMRELTARTWDELLTPGAGARDTAAARRGGNARGSAAAGRVATPDPEILAVLLADSASGWWDDRRTAAVERRDDVLAASLAAALVAVRAEHGEPDGGGWRWSRVRPRNLQHLLRIPALGATGLAQSGGPNTLSPLNSSAYGPSWRMVVELGPEVRGWGIYPGGQSGDPASPGYTDRLPRWLRGELDTLRVPRTPGALLPAQTAGTLTLTPAAGR